MSRYINLTAKINEKPKKYSDIKNNTPFKKILFNLAEATMNDIPDDSFISVIENVVYNNHGGFCTLQIPIKLEDETMPDDGYCFVINRQSIGLNYDIFGVISTGIGYSQITPVNDPKTEEKNCFLQNTIITSSITFNVTEQYLVILLIPEHEEFKKIIELANTNKGTINFVLWYR